MESKLTIQEIEAIRHLVKDGDMNMLRATMDVVDQLLDNAEKSLRIQNYIDVNYDIDDLAELGMYVTEIFE